MGMRRGEEQVNAKLTADQVRQIRELDRERVVLKEKLANLSQRAIADRFGVSKQRVWEIVNFRNGAWSHV
jgi:DNA-binding transcriptional regulator YiaG